MEEEKKQPPMSASDTELFVAGLQIAVCFVICAGIGYWLDARYHTGHRYTGWGVFLGLFCGIGNFVKALVGALHDKR